MVMDELQASAAFALFRLMKAFGLLERNLGLAIAHLERPGESERAYPGLAKLSTDGMIDRLGTLLKAKVEHSCPQRSADYEEWRSSVALARRIRNQFVHGYLDCLPQASEPVHLHRAPWHAAEGPIRMTVEQLDSQVQCVEQALHGFYKFREKYRI